MCNLLAQCPKGIDIRGSSHVASVQSQHPKKLDIISGFHSVLYRVGHSGFKSPRCNLLAQCPKRLVRITNVQSLALLNG